MQLLLAQVVAGLLNKFQALLQQPMAQMDKILRLTVLLLLEVEVVVAIN
jgi:hypothetical protein